MWEPRGKCYQHCQGNDPLRQKHMASLLVSATTSHETLKELQLYPRSLRHGTKAEAFKLFLPTCSPNKILIGGSKTNKCAFKKTT